MSFSFFRLQNALSEELSNMKKLQDDLLANKVLVKASFSVQASSRNSVFLFSPTLVSFPLPGPADSGAGEASAGVGSAESEARGLLFQVGAVQTERVKL